jgi:hypothetical protein
MSLERHHPNHQVDRNLGKARDLRSAHLFACLAMIAEFMTRPWRVLRRKPPLELPAAALGKQPV